MHRSVANIVAFTLTAGACFAEPDDTVARALADANIAECEPIPSIKPHITDWRYDIADGGDRLTIWGFPCDSGAYNTIWSVILWSERTGHRIVSLPIPLFSPTEDGDGFAMNGMVSDTWVWGASFNPESGLLRSAHPFRASQDAATIGYWRLRLQSQSFSLVRYEADMVMDSVLELLPVVAFE